MNPARRPVVAYTMRLSESEYGPEYSVKCDAYGLEMNIDDEWPIDTILMASPDLVDVITDETDVTSMGTVFVGAASPPSDGDFQALAGSAATWVLLENADAAAAALSAGLKIILCVEPSTDLALVLDGVPLAADQIILAITHEFLPTPQVAQASARRVREHLRSRDIADTRVVLAAPVDGKTAMNYLSQDDIDGVLLRDSGFGTAMGVLSAMAGR